MLAEAELRRLMSDLESDRVERTISTADSAKFREAICAFSNDFPNHRQPGYLLPGVHDKTGVAWGLKRLTSCCGIWRDCGRTVRFFRRLA